MTVILPAGLASTLASLVRGAGESVVVQPANGQPATVRASVQLPGVDNLINDAYQEGFVLYISPLDLPVMPVQFDRIEIRGEARTVHEAHAVEANGAPLMWMVRVLG